jgi:hypothetical protein
MLRRWFRSLFSSKIRPASRRRRAPINQRLECRELESRELLSVAHPTYILAGTFHDVSPLSGPGVGGYSPAQIRHAYGFDQISGSADGSGTTIAIVDAYDDPTIASDLQQFDATFGLPAANFTKVNQTGGSTMPSPDTGWSDEISLDVEWAHAIAPGAKILLVEANSASFSDLLTAVKYAASQPGVVDVSMSWGGNEFSGETAYDSYFQTPSGHSGVTFIASSGDSGAPPIYPAISPNVLAVGGTTLPNLDTAGDYTSESAWSGSGGGISSYEAQPSYQQGVVTQTSTYRTNPDVSYDADPNTGFPVYDSYDPTGPWLEFGGTSDAAPQWAALVAIADQGRAAAGEPSLDGPTQLLPMLYKLPSTDFHDITSGASDGSPVENATPGYDLATGRGTPLANLIVSGLVGQSGTPSTATHLSVTSTSTKSTAGTAINITVTALNASNQVVPGYTDTIHFTSSDGLATLPANYTFTTGNDGSDTFSVILDTAGNQTVTATDTSHSTINGSVTITVSPAATAAFRVSGFPSPTTAGVSGSFTVQATDAYGNAVTNYSGTVHFSSSDSAAVLPSNTTLSNGAGTFSATLKTAGTESITVADASNPSMTGTDSGIVVNPSSPTHIAFGQQPTNSSTGAAISPAVTVQLFDAYNNLVTTDNTDQVTLSFGTNPTGATLGGTTTVTVSHGVATFSNVSVSTAGSGYTLVAKSGTLPTVTSAAFSVSAATAKIIEGFENGLGLYYYVGYDYPAFYTETYAAHDGNYGLDNLGNNDWIFRTDAGAQVKAGEDISAWVQLANYADGRAYFGFGASDYGTLSLVLAPNTNQLILQNNSGWNFRNLSAVTQTYQANHWYRLEVDWSTTGAIVGKLYDSNGTTLLNSVTGKYSGITSGGIAFRATADETYWDTVSVITGTTGLTPALVSHHGLLVGTPFLVSGFTPAWTASTRSLSSGESRASFSAVISQKTPPALTLGEATRSWNPTEGNSLLASNPFGSQEWLSYTGFVDRLFTLWGEAGV